MNAAEYLYALKILEREPNPNILNIGPQRNIKTIKVATDYIESEPKAVEIVTGNSAILSSVVQYSRNVTVDPDINLRVLFSIGDVWSPSASGDEFYIVEAIRSDTEITISLPYVGTTLVSAASRLMRPVNWTVILEPGNYPEQIVVTGTKFVDFVFENGASASIFSTSAVLAPTFGKVRFINGSIAPLSGTIGNPLDWNSYTYEIEFHNCDGITNNIDIIGKGSQAAKIGRLTIDGGRWQGIQDAFMINSAMPSFIKNAHIVLSGNNVDLRVFNNMNNDVNYPDSYLEVSNSLITCDTEGADIGCYVIEAENGGADIRLINCSYELFSETGANTAIISANLGGAVGASSVKVIGGSVETKITSGVAQMVQPGLSVDIGETDIEIDGFDGNGISSSDLKTHQYNSVIVNNSPAISVPESSITVGGSPFDYINNTGMNGSVLITGGVVATLEFSRDAIAFYDTSITSGSVSLMPNDRVRVTYSSVPTMVFIPG